MAETGLVTSTPTSTGEPHGSPPPAPQSWGGCVGWGCGARVRLLAMTVSPLVPGGEVTPTRSYTSAVSP